MGCKNLKEEYLLCVVTIVDLAETAAGYLSSSCFSFAVVAAAVTMAVAVAATVAVERLPAANRKNPKKGRLCRPFFLYYPQSIVILRS